MTTKKIDYNLLFLDDALVSQDIGFTSTILLWIDKEYGEYINIRHAKNIKEAFLKLEDLGRIDILISDMNLPFQGIPPQLIDKYESGRFGGIYFIDEMLKINPEIRIIVSSGWDYSEYKDKLDKRVKTILSKPYEFKVLEDSIDTLIQEVVGVETKKAWEKWKKTNS